VEKFLPGGFAALLMTPLPLYAAALESLAWWGVPWLALMVAWAAACLRIGDDARDVFGHARPWKLLFVLAGVLALLATAMFGRRAFGLTFLPFPALAITYLVRRELVAPPDKQLRARQWVEDRVRGWLAGRPLDPRPARPRGREVVLLKKDGRPYEGSDSETSQAVKTVQGLILKAVDLGATDIHFDPRAGDTFEVRCRVDGMLRTTGTVGGTAGRTTVSVLKVLGDMDIAERRRSQDGTFAFRCDGRTFDVRAASVPTKDGEKITLRLLEALNSRSLEELGMRKSIAGTVRDICGRSSGMLIICGPTGEGKTTTAFAALKEIDGLTRNVVTIEDPIEYRLEAAAQIPVNVGSGQTFAAILRSVLRQDPDVILVGEIRDQETAEIAMRAALTGHLVFSTLHAKDTSTAVTRLIDMGIDATLLQSSLSAVVAQRLVKLLCPQCKKAVVPSDGQLRKYGLLRERVPQVYEPVGCRHCGQTGYAGRTGVHELMLVDGKIRERLVGKPSIEELRKVACQAGTRPLKQVTLLLVAKGLTSFAEVDRLTD
jgi:type II secretory ATPase GspE/PulE/Tfp pilus assembly ATPase PilB-like protein